MIEATSPSEQSLQQLYREHRGWLETWLRRRMGNAWDAADLSQDTFLRVLCNAPPLAELREPRAYLLTVGKRLLSNFYTRRHLEKAYLDAWRNCRKRAHRRRNSAGCCWKPCRRWMNCSMACRARCAGHFFGVNSRALATARLPSACRFPSAR